MAQYLALLLWISIMVWLFARERKSHPMTSIALWIPLLWVMIIGSRTISYWLNFDIDPEQMYTSSVEGSPVDRTVFLILVIGAAITLWRRRLDWGQVFSSNFWLFAFILYCGLSVIWSDYPFPSFKKWIKELGNVMMILIIITESKPVLALKAIFIRYIYFAISLSTILIIFFPELGTNYLREADTLAYCGVTINKNEFGHILAISGMFLTWDLLDRRVGEHSKTDLAIRIMLLAMAIVWLIIANSVTPLLCMIVGIAVIIAMRFPFSERLVRHLGVYGLLIGFVLVILATFPDVTEFFFRLVQRDATFTGRTDIWTGLMREPVNPLLGTGFQSFWLQPGMMERYDYINEAHNGYLETYLNGGLIGLSLLTAMLVSVGSKIKQALLSGNNYAPLLFSFLVVTVLYNLTESIFSRLDLTWFVFLIAALGSAQPLSSEQEEYEQEYQQEAEGAVILNANGGRE